MSGAFRDMAFCFMLSWFACAALAWVVPIGRKPFLVHMKARIVRVLGRMILVVVLVAFAAGPMGWHAPAVTVGVLGGWLLSSGWEAWQCRRAGDDGK